MPVKIINDVSIAYELHGQENAPVILLIHGLATSMAGWPQPFVDCLASQGFRVLLIDNRDIGASQYLDHLGVANLAWQLLRRRCGLRVRAPYSLAAMAEDAFGLIHSLDIDQVHVVGVSMGGMIAQKLAIARPAAVASLTSLMSTTNNRALQKTRADVARHMMNGPRNPDKSTYMAHTLQTWRLIGSPAFPRSDETLERYVEGLYDRGFSSAGTARQLLAVMAEPDRRRQLQQLRLPALVIHGREDPLIPVDAGVDTAGNIPGARLEIIDGMGHDIPEQLVERLGSLVASHARAAHDTTNPVRSGANLTEQQS